jgi:hypothetical protein
MKIKPSNQDHGITPHSLKRAMVVVATKRSCDGTISKILDVLIFSARVAFQS